MMSENRQCCETCKYSNYNWKECAWECINAHSEGYGLLIAHDDSCSDWEE